MHVWHIISSMGGGGAERQLCYLVEGLGKAGINSTVVVTKGGPNYRRLLGTNTKVVHLSLALGYVGILFQLLSLLRKEKPLLVQTWLNSMDIVGGFAALLANTPFIISERSNRLGAQREKWGMLHRFVARFGLGAIANSEQGLRFWKQQLPADKLCALVPNCVPVAEIDGISPSMGRAVFLHREKKWILYAGRLLESQKNLRTLLKCWEILAAQNPSLGFVVVGSGPSRGAVSALRAKLGERLLHFDYLPEYEMWAMMKRASLFMSCSPREGAPNVVMEAMACGTPLVLSDISEHRILAGPVGAAYAEVDSPESYVQAALGLLGDAGLSQRCVAECRRRILVFSLDETIKLYTEIYQRISARTRAK